MTMNKVDLNRSTRLISSGQVVLVTCAYKERRNIITLAWCMPLSHKPPLAGISIAKTHFSNELIRNSREFAINVPDFSLLDKVVYCGTHSGREVDKFKETRLTPDKANRIAEPPLIAECVGHLECKVEDIKEAGDHTLFIGRIVYAQAKEHLFKDTWLVNKTKLIFHLGGNRFTSSSGEVII